MSQKRLKGPYARGRAERKGQQEFLSVGALTRAFHVGRRTVIKWIDRGQLTGYRIPGGNSRRVLLRDAERFAREQNLPFDLQPVEAQGAAAVPVSRGRPSRDVLTTGLLADVFRVAPRTISKWFDQGLLKGHRIPGSNDRRVLRADAERFAAEYGLPFDLTPLCPAILAVGLPNDLQQELMASVTNPVLVAATSFACGQLASKPWLWAVISAPGLGTYEATILAQELRAQNSRAKVLILVGDDGTGEERFQELGFPTARLISRELLVALGVRSGRRSPAA
jgi:hypothetical protein